MKKNIIKSVIALVFVVGAIVSFNVDAMASRNPHSMAGTGDYNNKSLAQKSDGSYCCADSTDWNNCTSSPDC